MTTGRGRHRGLADQGRRQKGAAGKLAAAQTAEAAVIEADFVAALNALDSPVSVLAAELAALRAQQLTDLLKAIDGAKGQAIVAKYQAKIDSLTKKVQERDSQLSQLLAQRESKIAQATAAADAQIARLDNTLEIKLVQLQEQQWAAMAQTAGRANVKGILAHYNPRIAKLAAQQVTAQS